MRVLITGSDGLVGGACVEYFDALGWEVHGADNNGRKKYFGEAGSTEWNRHRIFHRAKNYHTNDTDICNRDQVWSLFHRGLHKYTTFEYDAVIHCAAQPSHDFANSNPDLDYDVNVRGTYNLLEAVRNYSPNAVFIFTSTNKVYDDYVNSRKYTEYEFRYDLDSSLTTENMFSNMPVWLGFDENALTGASNIFGKYKLEADKLVQKYATEHGLKTMVLRGGCLTGPAHSGVPLHGFLNYLIRCCATGETYKILGYKGKQVRDNIHSYDVASAMHQMIMNPRPGEVYNIGGGRPNSVSILEAIEKAEKIIGKKMNTEYVDEPRHGDHQCYITDMSKFWSHYPDWVITKDLDDIFRDTADQIYWGVETEHKETITYPELDGNSFVLDVGGCRGKWAQSISDKYDCVIDIFEPVKEFADACRYRFHRNDKIFVHQYGFGRQNTTLKIAKQGVNSSTVRTEMPNPAIWGDVTSESIEIQDIAALVKWCGDIDLMSINCEGGEFDILNRLIETAAINKFKNVQIQFHDFYPNAKEERDKIREKLKLTHTERFCYPFIWESWKIR